ncbi:hypothetical protein BC831DRAFT_491355 [Entophlyctis helioformis]|nr:hypothetical protein BC831DRAFT_491355 [Entophlyctis helioformis]
MFPQQAWFTAPKADPIVALRAFDNALKAGTNAQLLAAYDFLRSLGASALANVPTSLFVGLLERLVDPASSDVAGLTGTRRTDAAARIRSDFLESGHAASREVDLLALRSARFVDNDHLDRAVRLFRDIVGKDSVGTGATSAQAAAEQTVNAAASKADPTPSQDTPAAEVDANAQAAGASNASAAARRRPASAPADRVLCDELVAAFAAHGHVAVCKALIARMLEARIQPEVSTFCHLLDAYCNAGDLTSAETLSAQILSHGTPEQIAWARESLLIGFSRLGNATKAQKYFDALSRFSNGAVQTARAKDIKGAAGVGKAQSIQTTAQFNALIRVSCERGLPGEVMRVYKTMRHEGVEANSETYALMIRAYGRSKNLTAASRLFYKKENVPGFVPSTDMQAALIEAYILAGESLLAWRVLADPATDPSKQPALPSHWTFGPPQHLRNKQKRSSEAVSEQAAAASLFQRITLDMVAPLAKDLSGKHIDYLRDRMRLANIPAEARSVVIAQLMRAALVDSPAYGAQDTKLALDLYGEFTAEGGSARGTLVPVSAHAAAVEALGIAGRTDEAVALFERTLEDAAIAGEATAAYTALFAGLAAAAGSPSTAEAAVKYLALMQRDGVVADAMTLTHAARCFGSQDEARSKLDGVLTGATARGIVPDPSRHDALYMLVGAEAVESVCSLLQ